MNDAVDRDALWLLWESGGSYWAETAAEERAEAERLFAETIDDPARLTLPFHPTNL